MPSATAHPFDPSTAPPATRLLAEYVVNLKYDTLPTHVIAAARTAFMDWIAVATVASRTTRQGAAVAAVAREESTAGAATLFADGDPISTTWAAFANGAASHAIELDDIHLPSIVHGGVAMMAALVAVAEEVDATGQDLIEAIVAGFDVQYRLGEAIAAPHYELFHSTGTIGTFGATAACAKLLKLTVEQTQWAFGNAGSQAAGLWQYLTLGDDTKVLHPGKACMNGVLAAKLARAGFTGSTDIIEGSRGFVATLSSTVDWNRITDRLGEYYKVTENGYKIHACCRHGHVTIDETLRLAREHNLQPTDVASVTVSLNTNSVMTLDDPHPPTPYKAKFSAQFMVAHAFVYGHVGLEAFTLERLHNPKIRALMDRVSIATETAYDQRFPDAWTATVAITTTDGKVVTGTADMPRGEWNNPVEPEVIEAKAAELLTAVIGEHNTQTLLDSLKRVETVQSISTVMGLIQASAPVATSAH